MQGKPKKGDKEKVKEPKPDSYEPVWGDSQIVSPPEDDMDREDDPTD